MSGALQQSKINQALCPQNIELDSRTEVDRLSFAARFSALVLYYDNNNNAQGNWQPFLLKDPVILMALISKTNYQIKAKIFCDLSKLLNNKQFLNHKDAITQTINQLCSLLKSIFVDINDWLVQMENDHKDYLLKSLIQQQTSHVLGKQLWLFIDIQKKMSIKTVGIDPPDFILFKSFHSLWFDHASAVNVGTEPLNEQLLDIFNVLFSAYVKAIESAKAAYISLKGELNNYPDTALLITFIRLIEIHQAQLNELSEKHLNFYYHDVLKQKVAHGRGDETYLLLTLSEHITSYTLVKGTEFKGGEDKNGQTIIYQSTKEQVLNQAKIKRVQSLYYQSPAQSPSSLSGLYLSQHLDVDKIQKDKQLISWPLFGKPCVKTLALEKSSPQLIKQGFAFASPMLFLQGGERKIDITFTLEPILFTKKKLKPERVLTEHLFDQSEIKLSTKTGWLSIPQKGKKKPTGTVQENNETQWRYNIHDKIQSGDQGLHIKLTLSLPSSAPAIDVWPDNDEGTVSQWPLFKLLLNQQINVSTQVKLTNIHIVVSVDDCPNSLLSNDNGLLASDAAFLPFGPIVNCGARFYLDNRELLAKKLTALSLSLNWQNLPASFDDYYAGYNTFLKNDSFNDLAFIVKFSYQDSYQGSHKKNKHGNKQWQLLSLNPASVELEEAEQGYSLFQLSEAALEKKRKEQAEQAEKDKKASRTILSKFGSLLAKPFKWLKKYFIDYLTKRLKASLPKILVTWLDTLFTKKLTGLSSKKILAEPARTSVVKREKSLVAPPMQMIANESQFHFFVDSIIPQPHLLTTSTELLRLIKTGFSIELQQPEYGFGNSLYSKVLADVSQKNSMVMLQEAKLFSFKKKTIENMPNAAYAPELSDISWDYQAQVSQSFINSNKDNYHKDNYPFEFYHYDNFASYLVYDAQQPIKSQQLPVVPPVKIDPVNEPLVGQGINLYAGFAFDAILYLELTQLTAPCSLSVYFELCALHTEIISSTAQAQLRYFYLANNGWQILTLLSDETDQLRCSGIIAFDIPSQISPNATLMPGGYYCLAIAVEGEVSSQAIYINSQAVKVKRVLTSGSNQYSNLAPNVAEKTINATLEPIKQIAKIDQPFDSLNGSAKENKSQFYQRVSQRIGAKDRSSSKHDYINMSLATDDQLYYCKVLKTQLGAGAGVVNLGVVDGYANVSQAGAFTPMVSTGRLVAIEQVLRQKSSPFVTLCLQNLTPLPVIIKADIICAKSQSNAVCQQVEQAIKVYLSPWIDTPQQQITIDSGLNSAELLSFIASQPGVEGVVSISLSEEPRPDSINQNENTENGLEGGNPKLRLPLADDALIVSAEHHDIQANIVQQQQNKPQQEEQP